MNNIALLTIIIALVYAAIGLSTPLVTLYLQSLGADYSRIAIILATTAAVALVSSYLWGRASDALGRRKPLIVGGLAGVAVAYFLLSQVTGFDGAWAVRLGEAAAMAAYSTTSLALMGDLLSTSGARGKRMGTYRGIGSLAFRGRRSDRRSARRCLFDATHLRVRLHILPRGGTDRPAIARAPVRPGERD